jgi:hypothetical protein
VRAQSRCSSPAIPSHVIGGSLQRRGGGSPYGLVTIYVCQLRRLVIDQENGAILQCQKSVEADFRERLHDLFLSLKVADASAVPMHLRCHKSTSPTWLRVSRKNDLPSVRRPFRQARPDHCSAQNVGNCRNIGQLSYAWLLLSSDRQRVTLLASQATALAAPRDSHRVTYQRPFDRAWRPAHSGSFVSARPNSRSRPAMSAL